jgi:hypothetical protein
MANAKSGTSWARRLATLAAILSLGGVAAALIASLGAGQGAWHFRVGFAVLRYAFYAAGAGLALGLIALLIARRRPGRRRLAVVAVVASVLFLGYLGSWYRTASTVPALHDITTNLADVPQFTRLTVREDNFDNIPNLDRPELEAMPAEERWRAVHRESYADLRTVRLPGTVAEAIARAEALARERGWEVAHVDPAAGVMEATETSRFFRFKDDVVVRARPGPQGGTLVDMRSISRVGGSDVGVNAKRIRSFLGDLQRG